MSDPKPTPATEGKSAPTFRLKLSRNQKKRSKLVQISEELAPETAPPEPAPSPAPAPAPPSSPLLRRNRLKRSGHMHDDLTKPLPDDGEAEREDDY